MMLLLPSLIRNWINKVDKLFNNPIVVVCQIMFNFSIRHTGSKGNFNIDNLKYLLIKVCTSKLQSLEEKRFDVTKHPSVGLRSGLRPGS